MRQPLRIEGFTARCESLLNEGIPVEQARDRTGCGYDTASLKDLRGQKIG